MIGRFLYALRFARIAFEEGWNEYGWILRARRQELRTVAREDLMLRHFRVINGGRAQRRCSHHLPGNGAA